jgi:hypothetical protein
MDEGTVGRPPLFDGATPAGLTPVAELTPVVELTLGINVLPEPADPTGAFTDGMVFGTTPFTGGAADPVVGTPFKVGLVGTPFSVGLLRPAPFDPVPFEMELPFSVPLLFIILLPVTPPPLTVPLTPPAPFAFGSPGCCTPNWAWQVVICAPISLEQSVPAGNSLDWADAGNADKANAAPAKRLRIPACVFKMVFIVGSSK